MEEEEVVVGLEGACARSGIHQGMDDLDPVLGLGLAVEEVVIEGFPLGIGNGGRGYLREGEVDGDGHHTSSTPYTTKPEPKPEPF